MPVLTKREVYAKGRRREVYREEEGGGIGRRREVVPPPHHTVRVGESLHTQPAPWATPCSWVHLLLVCSTLIMVHRAEVKGESHLGSDRQKVVGDLPWAVTRRRVCDSSSTFVTVSSRMFGVRITKDGIAGGSLPLYSPRDSQMVTDC